MKLKELDAILKKFPRFPLLRGETPLHRLDKLSDQLNIDLWIKRDDLTGLAAGGNKSRKLEFLIGKALEDKADTVMTAGWYHSNHALQTAAAAARAGLHCILFLKEGNPRKGSLFLDRLCGAEIRTFAVSGSGSLGPIMEDAARELSAKGRRPYIIPVGGSDGTGALGYLAAALEIRSQCDRTGWEPERIVCATSSGGTHAGLALGVQLLFPKTRVLGIGVGDEPGPLMEKENGIIQKMISDLGISELNNDLNQSHFCFDYGFGDYGVLADPVFELIRGVGSSEGFFLDPVYTGKAFYGLSDLARKKEIAPGSRVLFLHTGGLSGLFQYEDEVFEYMAE